MKKLFSVIIILAMGYSLSAPAFAADAAWNVDVNGLWTQDNYWDPTTAPGAASPGVLSTDKATFSAHASADRLITVDAGRNIKFIDFGNTATFGYTLQTGAIALTNAGIIQTLAANGNHTDTISSAIAIQGDGGAATFTANATSAASLLNISGGVTGVSTAGNTTTLTLNGVLAGTNIVSGVIGDGANGGKAAVTKDGFGIWLLSGNNTYDGLTTINSGTLKLSGDNRGAAGGITLTGGELDTNSVYALGTGTLLITGPSTIDNSSGGALTLLTNNAQTWNGNFAFKGSNDLNLGTGAVDLGGATRLITLSTAGKTLTVGGVISGTGAAVGLTTADQGTLTLSGVNTYTGATTIGVGTTLALDATGTIATSSGVANSGTFTIAASKTIQVMTGAGATTLGANTLTIGDANNLSGTYTGVAAGTGGITKAGTGTLTMSGANTYSGATTVNKGTLAAGVASVANTSGAFGNNSAITMANDASAILDITGFNTQIGSITGGGTAGGNVTLGGATLTVGGDNTSPAAYAGVISGTGGITKAGTGTLSLSGTNNYAGATLINVDCGTVRVSNSAAFGTGAGGVTNNATLDVGSTTLNINGTYAQGAASTLMIAVNGASSGSVVATGNATATAGYTVALNVSNYVPNNQTYTIIDGAAGAGVAAPVITVAGSDRATFSATTVGTDLILTASRAANGYPESATNSNAAAAGTALESAGNAGATGDMATVLNTLDDLSNSQTAAALDTVVPEIDAGVFNTSTASLNNFVGVAIERAENLMKPAPKTADSAKTGFSAGENSKMSGIWGKGYGGYQTQDTRKGIQGYDACNAGTAFGVDTILADIITLGISGGYAYGNVDSDVNNGNTRINSAQTTVYGGYQDKKYPYFIDAAGSFAWNWYNGKRDIAVGAIGRTAYADYDGQQYGAYIGGGYRINVGRNFIITPITSLNYIHLRLAGYTETEAGALGLRVANQDYDILQSGVGGRLEYPFDFKWGTFTPEVHGKWLYDFIGNDVATTSTFTGGGASFDTNGCPPAQHSFDIGGRLSLALKNDVSIVGECDTELKEDFFGIYGSVALRYTF